MEKRKWKEVCDKCNKWKYDCHGYYGIILCPTCARSSGYKSWCKEIALPKEEIVNVAIEK